MSTTCNAILRRVALLYQIWANLNERIRTLVYNMAAITPGTNGSIKSATVEGQLQELCMYLQLKERSSVNNPTEVDNFSVTHAPDTGSMSASFTIPVQQTINSGGQVTYSASDYLTGLNFVAGEDGTFKSATAAGYFVEVVIYAQNLERQTAKNPTNRNGITGTFNSDSTLFSGVLDLPVSISIETDGSIKYTAEEYLLA